MAITKILANSQGFPGTAGAALSAGDFVGFNSSGALVKADADAGTPIRAVGVILYDVASGAPCSFATQAILEDADWSWTAPGLVYLSGTAGAATATKPSTATNIVQPIAEIVSATRLFVNIALQTHVLQAAGNSTLAVY